ncbi:MAG TPA: DUF5335 family protein [Bdellovibrionales bacterium]|nr:DUF5335 family protein [Bdellovibrionales bacterium]
MNLRTLDRGQWQYYFDLISKVAPGQKLELEVAGLDIGDQIEEEWVSLIGLSYEPKGDVLTVLTESMDHAIEHPKDIVVAEDGIRVAFVAIADLENHVQILRFRQPLLLQEPADVLPIR